MLFVLEGLDGIGKSVQSTLLKDYLIRQGYECHLWHFPRREHQVFGELIKDYLHGCFGSRDNINPYLIATLYANDQYLAFRDFPYQKNPRSAVILDRYYYSNLAYQGARFHDSQDKLKFRRWMENVLIEFRLPVPDIAIYLHGPPNFQSSNLEKRVCKDVHEISLQYQQDVHHAYMELCRTGWHGLTPLDCSDPHGHVLSRESIHEAILKLIHVAGLSI